MKIILPYDKTPENAVIQIIRGYSKKRAFKPMKEKHRRSDLSSKLNDNLVNAWFSINATHDPFVILPVKILKLCKFYDELKTKGFENTYEANHAKIAIEYLEIIFNRYNLKETDELRMLAPQSQLAADKSYLETALKLCDGLETTLNSYKNLGNDNKKMVYEIWKNYE